MTDRELLVEHLSNAPQLPADTCILAEDAAEPGRETMKEADRADFDLLINSYGALAPGLVLRDEDGSAIAAVLLDHFWGLDLGRRVFAAAAQGLARLEDRSDDPGALKRMQLDQINRLLLDLPHDIHRKTFLHFQQEAATDLQMRSKGTLEALQKEAEKRATTAVRDKILALARTAAAVDSEVRQAGLREAKSWLKEVAASS